MNWKSGKFLAIASLLVIAAIASASYALVSLGLIGVPSYPQIVINLEFLKKDPSTGKLAEASGILSSKDVMVELQVNAIAPPTEKEDIITLHSGVYTGKGPIVISTPLFQNLSREWVSVYKLRSINASSAYSGLIIRAIAFNTTSKQTIFQVYDSISYSPYQVANRNSLFVTIQAENSSAKALSIYTSYSKSVMLSSKAEEKQIGIDIAGPSRISILVAQITPENLTSYLPSDYFMNVNGKLYMKVPVMIANNTASTNNRIVAVLLTGGSYTTNIYPTFSYGKILDSLTKGLMPQVTLQKGSQAIWSSLAFFDDESDVYPNQGAWIWIWARPVYSIYKVYDMWQGYIEDDAQAVITDAYVINNLIQGGGNSGYPSQTIMDMLFKGSNFIWLIVPNSTLSDGVLSPGETFYTTDFYNLYDTCGENFEVGIPVGSIAACVACLALNLELGEMPCLVAEAFLSAFGVSISGSQSIVIVDDLIKNIGPSNEAVYIATSNYPYSSGSCIYKVPIGLYVELRPVS